MIYLTIGGIICWNNDSFSVFKNSHLFSMLTKLLLLRLQAIIPNTSKLSDIKESHISMAFIVLLGKGGLRRWDVSVIAFLSGGRNEDVGNPAIPKSCHEILAIQADVHCRMYCLQWPYLKEHRLWSQKLLWVSNIWDRKTSPKLLVSDRIWGRMQVERFWGLPSSVLNSVPKVQLQS